MAAVQLPRSRAHPGSRSCDTDGTAWHKPVAPASRRDRALSALELRNASPCRPQYRLGTTAHSQVYCNPAASELLAQNNRSPVIQANQMQRVLARIDANAASDYDI